MNSQHVDTRHAAFRILAITAGVIGELFAVLALWSAFAGDRYVIDRPAIVSLAVLTAIAIIALAMAWWRPALAGLTMLVAVAGYWYVVTTGPWSLFWADYQTAVRTSGAAENAFWFSGVIALPSLMVAALSLLVGVIFALLGHEWLHQVRAHGPVVS